MREIDVQSSVIDTLFADSTIECFDGSIEINEPVILRCGGSQSAIAIRKDTRLNIILNHPCYSLFPKNAEQAAALHMLCDDTIPLVTLVGKAGSGKTLLALAAAMQLQHEGRYKKILVARPAVGLGDGTNDIGFVPGTSDEKMEVWLGPIWDNLSVLKTDKQKISKMRQEYQIELQALNYIRGRSFNDVFVIIDESQNIDRDDIKTIVTRAGNNVKMVLTGDTCQIDQQRLRSVNGESRDGLSYLIGRTQNQPLVGHVKLKKSERSPLCELLSDLL